MECEKNRERAENLKKAVFRIEKLVEKFEPIKNADLVKICRASGIELVSRSNESHLIHELLETAINQNIVKNFNRTNLTQKEAQSETLERLSLLLKNCPPQSWRGEEQVRLQQFSTPPTVAYVLAKILNPLPEETILEPSAGTGSLAAWLKIAGCSLQLNEISGMRRTLLELQGYKPSGVNAEFLDELLPEEITPDGVLMNPPFSASGGRTRTGDSNFGFRHVKSALERMKKGGRLVALLGCDALTKTDKGLRFLNEIALDYDLKAVINLPKSAFYKYGTTFPTAIICIEKNDTKQSPISRAKYLKDILKADCQNLEDVLNFTSVFN